MSWELEQPDSSGAIGARQVADYARTRGLSENHIYGLTSNIQAESGFKPDALVNDGGAPAGGLFQHRADRLTALQKQVPDWRTNWQGQVDFALNEPEGRQYAQQQFSSPDAAAQWFTQNFERPSAANAAQRGAATSTAQPQQGWVLEDGPAPKLQKPTLSPYQQRAQTFREATKAGVPVTDPTAILFPEAAAEQSPLVATLADTGKQFLQGLWNGVQGASKTLQPLVPFPGAVRAAEEAMGFPSGQPPGNLESLVNPMPEAVSAAFQLMQQGANAAGVGKDFEAAMAMAPFMHIPTEGVGTQLRSMLRGKESPSPRPFAAEPAFTEGLKRPPPAPPKQLPSPAQSSAQAMDELLTKEAEFRQSPEQARLLRQQLAQQAEPTGQPLRPQSREKPIAAPEPPPAPPPEPAPQPKPQAEAPRVDYNGKVFKPAPDLNNTDVLYQRSVDKLASGEWTPQDIQALPSRESGVAGVRTAAEDIFAPSHGEAAMRAQEKYPGETITPENYLYRVKTPDGEGMLTMKQMSDIQDPKELTKLLHQRGNDITAENFAKAQAPKPPPIAPESPITSTEAQPGLPPAPPPEAPAGPKSAKAPAKSRAMPESDLRLSQWLRKPDQGGLSITELPGEVRALAKESRVPGLFKMKSKATLNELAERAQAAGYIGEPTTDALLAAVREDLRGKPVLSSAGKGLNESLDKQVAQEFKSNDINAVFDMIDAAKRDGPGVDNLVGLTTHDNPAVRKAAGQKLAELYPELAKEVAQEAPKPVPESALSPEEIAARNEMRGMLGGQKPPKFEKTPAGEQAVIPGAEARNVPKGAIKGKRKQVAEPTALEKASIAAEDADNQYVLQSTNSTLTPAEADAVRRAGYYRAGPRGGAPVEDLAIPYIRGTDLQNVPREYRAAILSQLPVKDAFAEPGKMARLKVAMGNAADFFAMPNSLVYRGVQAGEHILKEIDDFTGKVRAIRNFYLDDMKPVFEPIKNENVWKLLDTEGARAYAEDNMLLTVPRGSPRPIQPDMVKAAKVKGIFDGLTDSEKSQYVKARKWIDVNISDPLGFDPYVALSDYFPRFREVLDSQTTLQLKLGDGTISKALADSVPIKVRAWFEKPRATDAPANTYDIDAVQGLATATARRLALSGGMDPRAGTQIQGLLERINPALKSLSEQEPRLVPYTKNMIETVLGHGDIKERPLIDLITTLEANRTMGLNPVSGIKNYLQKLNTFAVLPPQHFARGFIDMYSKERLAIAKAVGADFSEGAILQELSKADVEGKLGKATYDVRKINDYSLALMKMSEESNQVHAFLSALRHGEDMFGKATPEAIQYARTIQGATQFGGAGSIIPSIQQAGAIGKTWGQLKRYSIAQLDFQQSLLQHPTKAAKLAIGIGALYGADGIYPGLDDQIKKNIFEKWPGGLFGALGAYIADDTGIIPEDFTRSLAFWLPGPAMAHFIDAANATKGAITGKDFMGSDMTPEQVASKGTRSLPLAGVFLNRMRKMIVEAQSYNDTGGDIRTPETLSEAFGIYPATGARAEDKTKGEIAMSGIGIQPKGQHESFQRKSTLADIRQEEIRVKEKAADLYVSGQLAAEGGDADRGAKLMIDAQTLLEDFRDKYEGARTKLTSALVKEARKRRQSTPSERQIKRMPRDLRGIEELQPPPQE